MTHNLDGDKQQLHQLVESLAPAQIPAALQYLSYLSADPMLAAMMNAPPDDEPYTEDQRRKDALAEAAITHGEGISHEEVLRELGA